MSFRAYDARMQSANDLISSLTKRNIEFWSDNGQIRFQAPQGALCEKDLSELRALKHEIIELLEQPKFASEAPLNPRPIGCQVPLTSMQTGFWNYTIKPQRGWDKRSCIVVTHMQGKLDVSLLQGCIEAIVERHESLRTRIIAIGDRPWQHVDAADKIHFEEVSAAVAPSQKIEEEIRRLTIELADESVDLSIGPLFKVRLLKFTNYEYALILALNHMIVDGVSKRILNNEIWTLYRQGAQGLPFSLPQLSLQFADFAVWQQRNYYIWQKKHGTYWRERLSGARGAQIPSVSCIATDGTPRGSIFLMQFGNLLSAKLRDIARRERTLLSLIVLTIYSIVMSRWCGQRDLLLTLVLSGRDNPRLSNLVGLLVTAVYFRIEVVDGEDLVDLLKRVAEEFYAAYSHQEVVIGFQPENPTQVIFNWVPTEFGDYQHEINDQLRIRPFPFRTALPAKFIPYFSDTALGIEMVVVYRPDLFTPSTVEQFGHSMRQVAETFCSTFVDSCGGSIDGAVLER